LGAVGDTPVRNPIISSWYGAVGGNVEIPVFNGFLYTARSREASLRAQAAQEKLRDLRDRISRDVRTSWLDATTAYDRLAVTQQLLDQANLALSLAQSRYNLGLGSIVELSQAQLQLTQAQISNAQAGYDYRLSLAVLQYQTSGILEKVVHPWKRLNHFCTTSLETVNLKAQFSMTTFIKIKKRKKKQSSFTTLHGILLSLVIAAFVGLIFVLVVVYYHPPPD